MEFGLFSISLLGFWGKVQGENIVISLLFRDEGQPNYTYSLAMTGNQGVSRHTHT